MSVGEPLPDSECVPEADTVCVCEGEPVPVRLGLSESVDDAVLVDEGVAAPDEVAEAEGEPTWLFVPVVVRLDEGVDVPETELDWLGVGVKLDVGLPLFVSEPEVVPVELRV